MAAAPIRLSTFRHSISGQLSAVTFRQRAISFEHPTRAALRPDPGGLRKTTRDFYHHLWHRLCPCRAYASPRACTATRVRHRPSNGLRIFAVPEVAPRLGAGRGAPPCCRAQELVAPLIWLNGRLERRYRI